MNLISACLHSFPRWLPRYSLVWKPHRNKRISWLCLCQEVGHGLAHNMVLDLNVGSPHISPKGVWTYACTFPAEFWAQVTPVILKILKHALLGLLACLPLPVGLPPLSVVPLAHNFLLSLPKGPLRLVAECSVQLLNCLMEAEQAQIKNTVWTQPFRTENVNWHRERPKFKGLNLWFH